MSPDLQRLIDLQRLETAIAEAKATIAAHPQRLAEAEAQLAAATQALDAAKSRLKENQDARRALEKDVALYQGRLAKFRDQQSAVKTNKEYQALGHEIETAQRDLGGVEARDVRVVEGPDVGALLAERGLHITTMGRGPDEDPLFFRATASAGALAAGMAAPAAQTRKPIRIVCLKVPSATPRCSRNSRRSFSR